MSKIRWSRIIQAVLVFAFVFAAGPQMEAQAKAKAAQAKTAQTATLRIISSTDLHGQVSTMHYDTASDKPGSLAQVYTLMKQARSEVGADNTLTVDIGDSVYGYAADYILEHSGQDAVQPIYKAMSAVGYDAITLGNHDFDYGYDYIEKQLELSGLKSRCVVSNIFFTDTGKTAWNDKMIVTKRVKTSTGETVKVQVGIIGISYPSMSTYSDCKENLASWPIVSTVEKQAAALKNKGVDLVVVLAHSSFGTEEPLDTDNNAVYALTKLKNVDAVVAGHAHKNFPSTDEDVEVFYQMPNVDRNTGLVNGKPVTMVKDHGAGIGMIDLNLNITSNGIAKLAGAQTSLRMVDQTTAASKEILNTQTEEVKPVDSSLNDVIGTLGADEKVDSYFALLEDNYAIQLVNESKIQYGLSYTGGEGKSEYGDYPVVAATRYTLCGSQSAKDQINLDGSITMGDILNMQQANHNNNLLYWVSGSQLREWLEWSASIYDTADGSIQSDAALQKLLKKYGAKSIAAPEWLNDWGAFAVFDGIEYTIDATQKPRYNKTGNLKNADSHRIVNLTCNGQPVGEEQKFILVTNSVTTGIDATGAISTQKVLGKTDMAYQHLITYIKMQQKFGDLTADTDDNWEVLFDSDSQYIVRSSILSQTEAVVRDWFRELADSSDTFAYYLARFIQPEAEEADLHDPLLVASAAVAEETNAPVEIKVQASDRSGISQLKWTAGQETEDSAAWAQAQTVTGGAFTADTNGVYSVMAEDANGNRIVKHVGVENINPDIVPAPTINKVSNRSSQVTGKAQYGTTVHIDADGSTYETKALKDGTYVCTVQHMDAGRTVTAYCMDSSGRRSGTVSIAVFKNGPNKPVVDEITNKSLKVTGSYTDGASAIVAIVGKDVYCSGAEGQEIYKISQVYNNARTMQAVDYVQNGNTFEFFVPTQDAGKDIKFVALDKAGRRSATLSVTAEDVAPNIPEVYDVCSVEDTIYGKASNIVQSGTAIIVAGDRQYAGKIAEDGTFAVKAEGLEAGRTVAVYAADSKDGVSRMSRPGETTVVPYTDYTDRSGITVETVYDNSLQIKGYTLSGYRASILIRGAYEQLAVDEAGHFAYDLAEPLQAGEKVYFAVRDQSGRLAAAAEVTAEAYQAAVPETPSVLTSQITSGTQQIEVLAKEPGTVVMEIEGIKYTSQDGAYNQSYGGYIYTLDLPQAAQEQTITIYLVNAQGVSSNTVSVVRTYNENQEAIPDNPLPGESENPAG